MLGESNPEVKENVNAAKDYYSEELRELEQMLLQFREAHMATVDTYMVFTRWQHEIPRLHAFVRGMLYGL
jgi:hypothetical protein